MEAAVDHGVRSVGVYLGRCVGVVRRAVFLAWRGLDCHVPDGAVERGVHEFGVIFVEDLFADDGGVFALLREVGAEKV